MHDEYDGFIFGVIGKNLFMHAGAGYGIAEESHVANAVCLDCTIKEGNVYSRKTLHARVELGRLGG